MLVYLHFWIVTGKPENVNEGLINEMVQPMVNAAVAINHGHSFDITDTDTNEKITIGEGNKLFGADKKVHDDLSKLRINNKPLARAISEGSFAQTREERQVQRADIERDEVAERSAERAERLLKDRQEEGIDPEQQREQQEQEAAA